MGAAAGGGFGLVCVRLSVTVIYRGLRRGRLVAEGLPFLAVELAPASLVVERQ